MEFQNVILILGDSFGRKRNYFSNLIKHLDDSSLDTVDDSSARNLLYVSVTRARNNLAILYTDEPNDEQKKQLSAAFGEIRKAKSLQAIAMPFGY